MDESNEVKADAAGLGRLAGHVESSVRLLRNARDRFRSNTAGMEDANGNQKNPNVRDIVDSVGSVLGGFITGGGDLVRGVDAAGAFAEVDRQSAASLGRVPALEAVESSTSDDAGR